MTNQFQMNESTYGGKVDYSNYQYFVVTVDGNKLNLISQHKSLKGVYKRIAGLSFINSIGARVVKRVQGPPISSGQAKFPFASWEFVERYDQS